MRVLIVDDSQAEAQIMQSVLVSNGHSCTHVSDGVQGEEAAATTNPDLVLLDVVMPKKNGFQVCRALKRNETTKDIPVILVTSKGEETDRQWGLKQGASAYLVKPYEPQELIDLVEKFSA